MKETLNTSTEDGVIKNSMASEEAKEYFKLATPMLLTQLAAHATGIISALMTGNYNTVDQAAVAIGNMLFWPAYFWDRRSIVYRYFFCCSILWRKANYTNWTHRKAILLASNPLNSSICCLHIKCRFTSQYFRYSRRSKDHYKGLFIWADDWCPGNVFISTLKIHV